MGCDFTVARTQWLSAALALLFGVGVAATVADGAAMAGMGGVPMPGGWTLSGAWAPVCGEGWGATAAEFLGMWAAMTVAMMTPVVAPVVLARRGRIGEFGLGYAVVWLGVGAAVFAVGSVVADVVMRHAEMARWAPFAAGAVVVLAGLSQFSGWKVRRLAVCKACGRPSLRSGVRFGARCAASCAGPTTVLLALGVMNLWAMGAVASAVALERLANDGARAARATGGVAVMVGFAMIVRAIAKA